MWDVDILRDLQQPISFHMGTHCSDFHNLIAYFISQNTNHFLPTFIKAIVIHHSHSNTNYAL